MTGPANEASERAAHWILRQEEPDWSEGDSAELAEWLEVSPLNRAAYLRLRTGWRAADRIGSLGPSYATEANGAKRAKYRQWRPWAIAASLTLVVGSGSVFLLPRTPSRVASQTFETQVGARKDIVLADHSKVELNTATHIRTSVSANRREVWLDRGEAFFDVKRRESAPFVIHAGTRTITVLGTKFSVRRDGTDVTVSVLEGRVRVDDTRDLKAIRSTTITAGDVAFIRDAATLVAVHAETRVENALGWREGMLTFDDVRVADAVKEFNRYHNRQIVVEDILAADMRIDGAFQAANVDAFLHLLRDAYGLKITERAGTIKISD